MKALRRILALLVISLLIVLAHAAGVVGGFLQTDCAQRVLAWTVPFLLCRGTDCGFSDTEGRQEVSCESYSKKAVSAASGGVAVILTLGQSNAANFGEVRFAPRPAVDNFNPFDGRCYRARDPLLGTDGRGGSPWSRLGDLLVATGRVKRILIVPIAVGGSSIERWAPDGDLHPRIRRVKTMLDDAGVGVTHVLWHQGESDARATSGQEYAERFGQLLASLREVGLDAPVYAAVATWCGGVRPKAEEIRAAQESLPRRFEGVFPGPDTDQLDRFSLRHEICHFSEEGLKAHAALWAESVWRP